MNLPTTIETALVFLKKAKCPEDVFGEIANDVKANFRELAMLVHEDKAPDNLKKIAHEAFLLLTDWNNKATDKIDRGTYGDKKVAVVATLVTKTNEYKLTEQISENDIAQFYLATNKDGKEVLVKVTINPRDNDLMKNEADVLAELPSKVDPKHAGYFPTLLDSFEIGTTTRQRVNVFHYSKDAVTLKQVKEAYPDGIPTIHAAWMWNRVLEALHLLHVNGYVHASVTPNSFIIVPDTHQGILIDFCYCVKTGEKAKIIDAEWENNYPKEVFDKQPLDGRTDVYMASYLIEYLLNNNVPFQIQGIVKASRLGKAYRMSAQEVHADMADVWKRLHGPKKFHVFNMPKKV